MNAVLGAPRVEVALRWLAAAVGVLLLLMGLGFLVMPELLAAGILAAEPARAVGINSLRGDFGGLFLGMGLFTLAGTLTHHRRLLSVPIAFLALIVMGRLTSMIVDDLPVVTAGALAGEVLFVLVLSLSMRSSSVRGVADRRSVSAATLRLRVALALGVVAVIVVGAFQVQRQIGLRLLAAAASSQLAVDGLEALPDGLHVGLAGTGAPLPEQRRHGGCSFVLAGEHLFIVDSGPGSTKALELMRLPLADIRAVLLTHLHSDHMGGLGELMLKAWTRGARTEPLNVVGPEGVEQVVAGFNLAYSIDTGFRVAHHPPTIAAPEGAGGVAEAVKSFDADGAAVIFQAPDLKVTAFLVDHRPVKPAFGYRFDYKGRSVVISGDTLPSESLRRQTQGADILLHEALQPEMLQIIHDAGLRGGQPNAAQLSSDILTYHTFPEEVARIARDANVRHVVFHHFLPQVPMRIFHSAFLGGTRDIFPGPVTMGVEGMVFSLPPGTSDIQMGWLL
ncbi:MAG: MBL fold metallo-hydrolase [Nannocystis sp.]|nr:MBL fold metallo-hydrolase [Nannocystis sp.]